MNAALGQELNNYEDYPHGAKSSIEGMLQGKYSILTILEGKKGKRMLEFCRVMLEKCMWFG